MELNLCMKCMREMSSGEAICPHCGFEAEKFETAPHHLPYGTILSGKYVTGAALGEGGFGITYIGYDLNLGIRVAIKEFYPNQFASRNSSDTISVRSNSKEGEDFFRNGKNKFYAEARGLARFMNLPGIVNVRDLFFENNTAYIVMDYIEGRTLSKYAEECGGKIAPDELFALVRPIIDSLSQIHEKGMIHRDISPGNIMIDHENKAWLIDFGSVHDVAPEDEKTITVMYKPGYSPKEQYSSKSKQGPWTDVYSMCATLYFLLTGVKPDQPFDRQEQETLVAPFARGVQLTLEQEKTLLHGLAINVEDRLKSMQELYDGLYQGTGAGASTGSATGTKTTNGLNADPEPVEGPAGSDDDTAPEPVEGSAGSDDDTAPELVEGSGEEAMLRARLVQALAAGAEKKASEESPAPENDTTKIKRSKNPVLRLLFVIVLAAVIFWGIHEGFDLHLEKRDFYNEYGLSFQLGEDPLPALRKVLLANGCRNISFYKGRIKRDEDVITGSFVYGGLCSYTVHYDRGIFKYQEHVSLKVAEPEIRMNVGFIDTLADVEVDYTQGRFYTLKNADYLTENIVRGFDERGVFLRLDLNNNDNLYRTEAEFELASRGQVLAKSIEQYWIDEYGAADISEENRKLAQYVLLDFPRVLNDKEAWDFKSLDSYVRSNMTGKDGWWICVAPAGGWNISPEDALQDAIDYINEFPDKNSNLSDNDGKKAKTKATSVGAASITCPYVDNDGDLYPVHWVCIFVRYKK